MQQNMRLTLRATGATLPEILKKFQDQLSAFIDGQPLVTSEIIDVGMIAAAQQGCLYECSQTYDLSLGDNYPPNAEFAALPTGLSVQFDGNYSTDVDGTITGFAWDFDDGGVSTEMQPVHIYLVAGTYHVTLTVTDDHGASSTVTHEITVAPANVLPIAEFAASVTGLSVQFDGNYSSDPDGTLMSYVWDFGDSATSTEMQPVHVYAAPGTYTATLTVTDSRDGSTTMTHDVTVTA